MDSYLQAPAAGGIAPLLIHIGLHKTGSSWLQKRFFNDRERGFTDEIGDSRHELIRRLVQPDPLFFDAAQTAEHYRPRIEVAKSAGLTPVISHERLSGHPSAGGFDRCVIAERLHATFPDARILIVIREQCELIRSAYNQLVSAGSAETLRQFLRRSVRRSVKRPAFSLEFYQFDRFIRLYQDLFGAGRVLVLPTELLALDPQEFADRIATFCGQPKVAVKPTNNLNARRPQIMTGLQRPLNMLFYDNDLSPGAFVDIPRFNIKFSRLRSLFERISPRALDRRWSHRQLQQIKAVVGSYYAESNCRTEKMTGLPLATLGYATSAELSAVDK